MDILLTHGYHINEDAQELKVMRPYPPLGILYLSAYLKRAGYAVGVHDSTFSSRDSFRQLLAKERPGIVGIYGTLISRSAILHMIRTAREHKARVVLGGPEPAAYPEEYLQRGADVIVLGEGEATLDELIPQLTAGDPHQLDSVRGIAFRRDNGSTVRTGDRPMLADLDALPEPDREAIDIPHYLDVWRKHHGLGSLSLLCARGCPHRCEWCSHAIFGRAHRRRSPSSVAAEAASLCRRYKPDQLWYSDDVFTMNRKWLLEYAAALGERRLRIPFECISRADRLDEEVLDALAEMNCRRLWIGSESGSQRILNAMCRDVTVEQIQWAIRALKQRGIESGMFIMLGYEGEKIADLKETVEHLKKAAPDVFLTTVAYPIKGTEYFAKVQDRLRSDKPWEQTSDREFRIQGRRSRRFYSYATRWMVNAVALYRAKGSAGDLAGKTRAALNMAAGRLGMLLTSHETETKVLPGT